MLTPDTFLPSTPEDFLRTTLAYSPDAGEYLGAHVDQAFDRTTTGRVAEEYGIMQAEKDEGTWDQHYAQGQVVLEHVAGTGVEVPAHRFAMTEDEWKASEYYLPTAKYRPDMTLTRARIMKENYDQRRYLDLLVQRGDESFGLGMKALAFGASLVGSLPDPINFIPFAGGLRGASVGAGIARGALEGAAGNALVDALVLPDLANRGEDVGMADALLDITFGAALGGVLGGIGGYIGKRWGQRAGRADGELTGFDTTPDGNLLSRAGQDMLPRHADADLLRASLGPQDRAAIVQGMEKALADMHADRPVDVGPILRDTPTISKAQYQAFLSQLEGADDFTDVRFGQLRQDLKESLNAIRTEEGVALLDGDDLVIPANVVKKLHEKRMLEGRMSADEVGQLLLDVFHRDADLASSTKYPHIQAVVALRKELSSIGFIGRNDLTGETIVKSVYKEKTPRIEKRLGGKKHSGSGGRGVPHPVDGAEAPPFAASRLSAVQSTESVKQIIDAPRSEVNYAVERPDDTPPAPPLPEAQRELAEDLGLDPATGLLPEERTAADLDTAGRVAPEDREALLAAQEQARRVQDYDDIAQGIIPCILEVPHGE